MQIFRGTSSLLLFLCVLLCATIQAQSTPEKVPKATIAVEPLSKPPVGSVVVVRCKGPLKKGAALVYDGDGSTNQGNPVVSFIMVKADGGAPNIQKTSGEVNRFTIFLDGDRNGVKIEFKMRFRDNGFYRCVFYDKDTKTVFLQSRAINIQSFYPPEKPKLESEERVENGKYVVDVTCSAYTGYPPGKLVLSIDGIDDLDVGKPGKTKATDKKGDILNVTATIAASLNFNGTMARCISGAGENPLALNSSFELDIQVPATPAMVKDAGIVFRHPGSRLVCESVGNPPPRYSWTFNHNKTDVTSRSFLVPKTPGVYEATCTVSNEVLGKEFRSRKRFSFAVVPEGMPCSNIREEDSAHTAFVISTVLACIFAIIALIVVVVLIVTKRKSGYDKM